MRPTEGPTLSREEFFRLAEIIEGFCGIQVPELLRPRLARLLAPRLEALNLRSPADYRRYVLGDPGRESELYRLAEAVANNETYFFREEHQLRAFSEEILPELAARRRRGPKLAVWSAGCSTGEEPYTIAILLLESGLLTPDRMVVFGTDISARALAKARRAVYGPSSFRTEWARDPAILERYFQDTDRGLAVRPQVRRLVRLAQGNLLDPASYGLLPSLDVIFCRNVLIYFPDAARTRVLSALYEKLRPGGYLLLGHAETLLSQMALFECVVLESAMVYRKPPLRRGEEA